jgi:hypothetical protein
VQALFRLEASLYRPWPKIPLTGTRKAQPAELLSFSPLSPHSTCRRIPNESCFANPIHKLIPPTNNRRSPLDISLAAKIWQTSAASFEYQQFPVQVLAVDVPTRLPQRAFAHVLRLAVFLGGRSFQVRLANRHDRQTSSRHLPTADSRALFGTTCDFCEIPKK